MFWHTIFIISMEILLPMINKTMKIHTHLTQIFKIRFHIYNRSDLFVWEKSVTGSSCQLVRPPFVFDKKQLEVSNLEPEAYQHQAGNLQWQYLEWVMETAHAQEEIALSGNMRLAIPILLLWAGDKTIRFALNNNNNYWKLDLLLLSG